jgi:hypothetical protein
LVWTVESLESSHNRHFIFKCGIAAYEATNFHVFAFLADTTQFMSIVFGVSRGVKPTTNLHQASKLKLRTTVITFSHMLARHGDY